MRNRFGSRGFTLIATLLLLLLMSGLAIGLLMMVNTEGKVGGSDVQNQIAYRNAEGGIEQMTSNLATVFQSVQAPSANAICGLNANPPVIAGVTWKDYQVQPTSGCGTNPPPLAYQYGQIQSGPNQGLWAQIIPISMLATAATPGNQEVSMTRTAQLALIPVFQFGVFSESDLGFYSSPTLNFNGRVHTNGDLYLGVASGYTLTFHDKLTAYGNVVRAVLPNGLPASSYNDTGTVLIPTASQGCDGTQPACRGIGSSEGSVVGAGGNPPASSQNTNWPTVSLSTYKSWIIDGNYGNKGGTGAAKLSMPFVNGTNFAYQIVRRPPPGVGPTSSLGSSLEYNMAQIHVLLSDTPAELPVGAVRLANAGAFANGVTVNNVTAYGTPGNNTLTALKANQSYNEYFATASSAAYDPSPCKGTYCTSANQLTADWSLAPLLPGANSLRQVGDNIVNLAGAAPAPTFTVCNNPVTCPTPDKYATVTNPGNAASWNLIDGYLYVEYLDNAGNWNNVTQEWLNLGFSRGEAVPTAPGANAINPNAILLLQQPANRDAAGLADPNGLAPKCTKFSGTTCVSYTYALPPDVIRDASSSSPYVQVYDSTNPKVSNTQYNWYPINFYDAREGEPRDTAANQTSCTVNGVMNAVEIDVGNLSRWLAGTIPGNGKNVNFVNQNGYVLYFSDRRGMLPNPNAANVKTGDSGLEDSINSSSATGAPDGKLDPIPPSKQFSPEDVNQNGLLDNWGGANLGQGFWNSAASNLNGSVTLTAPKYDTYSTRINSCVTTARKNWVSGARHVLKLVDGGFGNVPVRPDSPTCTNGTKTWTCKGGFTVASENPVYIQGDYNSNANDTIWKTPSTDSAGFAAAGIVADAVTVLSNNWTDLESFTAPTPAASRPASNTYYRVAIAAGKSMNFPFPGWETATNYGTGTDGGVHNFLRFLESWSGVSLNYYGSLVSLYYSTYNTGMFKCCSYAVYQPPSRNYIFDPDFANPQGLPPGTPMFKDVNNLMYRQIYTQRTY